MTQKLILPFKIAFFSFCKSENAIASKFIKKKFDSQVLCIGSVSESSDWKVLLFANY